jgi:hypothetical protein
VFIDNDMDDEGVMVDENAMQSGARYQRAGENAMTKKSHTP